VARGIASVFVIDCDGPRAVFLGEWCFFSVSAKKFDVTDHPCHSIGGLILGQPHGAIDGASLGQGLSCSVSRRCDARSNHWFNSSTLNGITKGISIVNIVSTSCLEHAQRLLPMQYKCDLLRRKSWLPVSAGEASTPSSRWFVARIVNS